MFRNHSKSSLTVKKEIYNLDIMRQTACLVVNPSTADSYTFLFNGTSAVRASDSNDGLNIQL